MNKVSLVGRIVRDPEVKTAGGSEVCNFSVAVQRKFKNAQGNYDADFINCVAWQQKAKFIGDYFQKGSWIGIDGWIQTGSYTDKDGNKRTKVEVNVNEVEFVGGKSEGTAKPAEPRNDSFQETEEKMPWDEDYVPF